MCSYLHLVRLESKHFCMDPLTLVSGAASLGASIFGQIKAAKANRENQRIIGDEINDLTSWYETEKNRNFLDSNMGKDVLTKAKEAILQRNKENESRAVITGASDESKVAAKKAEADSFNNSLSRLASYGSQREDRIEGNFRQNLSGLLGQKMQLNSQQAESASNLSSNASDVLSNIALGGLYPNMDAAINKEP